MKTVDPLKETIKLRDETIVDYEERLALTAQHGHKILEIADELKKAKKAHKKLQKENEHTKIELNTANATLIGAQADLDERNLQVKESKKLIDTL